LTVNSLEHLSAHSETYSRTKAEIKSSPLVVSVKWWKSLSASSSSL
jgi:hypothetical protein